MRSLDDLKELGRFEISFLDEDNAVCSQKISHTEEYKYIQNDLVLLKHILEFFSLQDTDPTKIVPSDLHRACFIIAKNDEYLNLLHSHAEAGRGGKEELRRAILEEIEKFEEIMENNYGLIWDWHIASFREKDKEVNNESF